MTKSEMKQRCKQILHQVTNGQYITNSDDVDFLKSLIKRHPQAGQKIGCGIASFFVETSEPYKTRCFFIKRTDGSITDFSYITCINAKVNKLNNIKKACRHAIRPIIQAHINSVVLYNDECPITGEVLTPHNFHIDHYDLTFAELFAKWMENQDVDHLYSQTNHQSEDLSFDTKFLNPHIIKQFVEFHNNNTHLRAVSRDANLSILRK